MLIIKRDCTPKLKLKLNSMEVVTGVGSLYTEIVIFIQYSSHWYTYYKHEENKEKRKKKSRKRMINLILFFIS